MTAQGALLLTASVPTFLIRFDNSDIKNHLLCYAYFQYFSSSSALSSAFILPAYIPPAFTLFFFILPAFFKLAASAHKKTALFTQAGFP